MVSKFLENSKKPAPKWFRKFKKIFVNTENAVLTILLIKFPADSPILIWVKIGSSWILETLETLLANGEEYVFPETTVPPQPESDKP